MDRLYDDSLKSVIHEFFSYNLSIIAIFIDRFLFYNSIVRGGEMNGKTKHDNAISNTIDYFNYECGKLPATTSASTDCR